jgi:hypothetical protein
MELSVPLIYERAWLTTEPIFIPALELLTVNLRELVIKLLTVHLQLPQGINILTDRIATNCRNILLRQITNKNAENLAAVDCAKTTDILFPVIGSQCFGDTRSFPVNISPDVIWLFAASR